MTTEFGMLAESSQKASFEIKSIIQKGLEETELIIHSMQETIKKSMEQSKDKRLSQFSKEIEEILVKQKVGISEINHAISLYSSSAQEIKESSENVHGQSDHIKEQVEYFDGLVSTLAEKI